MKKSMYYLLAVLFLLSGNAVMAQEEVPIDSVELPWVGDLYGNGIVYHVDEVTRKVLVVSLTEAPSNAPNFYRTWGEQGLLIPEASYGENGKKNTAAIIVAQVIRPEIIPQNNPYPNPGDYRNNARPADTARRAAHWCTELQEGEEWFLPSREQLKKLYEAKVTVNRALSSLQATPLGSGYYWSSTQLDADNAWYVFFDNGEVAASAKSNNGNVRAIKEYSFSSTPPIDDEQEENGQLENGYDDEPVVPNEPNEPTVVQKSGLQILLYPTFTTGMLNVEGLEGQVKVYVYNAFGTLLMSQEYESGGAFTLNLSEMPGGTLFVRFISGGLSVTKQIVKQ